MNTTPHQPSSSSSTAPSLPDSLLRNCPITLRLNNQIIHRPSLDSAVSNNDQHQQHKTSDSDQYQQHQANSDDSFSCSLVLVDEVMDEEEEEEEGEQQRVDDEKTDVDMREVGETAGNGAREERGVMDGDGMPEMNSDGNIGGPEAMRDGGQGDNELLLLEVDEEEEDIQRQQSETEMTEHSNYNAAAISSANDGVQHPKVVAEQLQNRKQRSETEMAGTSSHNSAGSKSAEQAVQHQKASADEQQLQSPNQVRKIQKCIELYNPKNEPRPEDPRPAKGRGYCGSTDRLSLSPMELPLPEFAWKERDRRRRQGETRATGIVVGGEAAREGTSSATPERRQCGQSGEQQPQQQEEEAGAGTSGGTGFYRYLNKDKIIFCLVSFLNIFLHLCKRNEILMK